ncbi:MAG: hypothetical protein IJP94_02705, partial [Clostridia bacterium]|nr:hypothetical protein [Clostridia bacterium]
MNIYGGTVTAVAGAADDDKGSSVAIGAGGSAEDYGTLTIGDGMNIYGGTNKNNLAVITKENDNYARKPYMTISSAPIHIHSLTYEADGATITATCSEADCSLNENKATLTIGAPGDTTSNATVLESEEGLFPGYTVSYSSDGGNTWVDTAPTEQGFYTAKLEWAPEGGKTYTAKIKYGISCITYDTETTNGTINGATNAAVGAMVTPTIEPGEGYELDTLTVTPESGSGINADDIIINGGSFVMPEANVTVSATFKKLNYSVTVSEAANGTVTAVKTTAQMGDAVEISVQSEAGYVLDTLKYNDGTTDTEVTLNADNKYQFTMPAKNVTVTATFAKLTTYTVFYRASGSPTSVLMRFNDSGEGVEMLKSTKLGDNMSCWEIQVSAKEGLTKLPIAFKEDGGSWSTLIDRSVVSNISSSISEGNAEVLNGNVDIFLVSFVWGDIEKKEY